MNVLRDYLLKALIVHWGPAYQREQKDLEREGRFGLVSKVGGSREAGISHSLFGDGGLC